MKRTMLLNRELSAAVASMGHTDLLAIVDAGYSIPRDANRIDLAVRPGLPGLIDVLEVTLSELAVESYLLATEMADVNPRLASSVEEVLAGVPSRHIPQAHFKELVGSAKVVVRSAEYSPYGNVLLVGGVTAEFLRSAPAEVGRG